MSFNNLGDAKKPFVDALPPDCTAMDEDFGKRRCMKAMSLSCSMGKMVLESGKLDQTSLDNFSEFMARCSGGLEIVEGCSTGHQICHHEQMPEYQSPSMDELAQNLFTSEI